MKNSLDKLLEEKKTKQIKLCVATIEHAAIWWENRNNNDDSIPTKKEAAFELLQSIACLVRLTGKIEELNLLSNLSKDERRELALAASNYILNSSTKEEIEEIFSNEDIDCDMLNSVEEFLLERDEAQLVWDTAKNLTIDFLEGDDELLQNFTLTKCYLNEIDQIFRSRMDIIAVASRFLVLFRDMTKQEMDKNTYWWFFEAREYDKKTEKIIADKNLLFQYLGLCKNKVDDVVYDLSNVINIFDSIINHNFVCEPAMAAATGKRSPFMVWENPINEIKEFFESGGKISDSAELDKQIRQLSSGFSASWYIDTLNIKGKFIVYIIGINDLKVIGLAEYDSETMTITLDKIIDDNKFKEYIDAPEKLLLILKK